MNELTDLERALLARIAAATPDDLQPIISGGWAARLHRLHPWSTSVAFAPLLTKDLDIALKEARTAEKSLLTGLRAQGFRDEPRGDEAPPIERYVHDSAPEFEMEFITDLQGATTGRGGQSRRTVAISGVTAQRTRHVGVLLEHAWTFTFDSQHVLVANPGRYLVQKLLSLLDRKFDAKQAKDAVYVHDTLLLFQQGQQLNPEFIAAVTEALEQLTESQKKRLREVRLLLEDGASRVLRAASTQLAAVGRNTPASTMALLCRLSFLELRLP